MLIADTPYPLHTQRLKTAAGTDLAYADVGRGFPVLFIHGLGSYLPAWQKNISSLSRHFRCLALDLPGFGKSSKEGFTPGMHFYADVVADFLDRQKIEACYLVGHSMGGQVALHTALKYPSKVKKLSLIAPAGLERFSQAEATQLKEWFVAEKLLQAPLDTVERNLKINFYSFPEDAELLLQDRLTYTRCSDYPRFCQVLSQSVSAMLQEPVWEQLPQLQMPVQLLFGRQDAYIPSPLLHPQLKLEEVVHTAARIPQAEVRFLDQCGHFVQWEQAQEVNRLLLKFFGVLSIRGTSTSLPLLP